MNRWYGNRSVRAGSPCALGGRVAVWRKPAVKKPRHPFYAKRRQCSTKGRSRRGRQQRRQECSRTRTKDSPFVDFEAGQRDAVEGGQAQAALRPAAVRIRFIGPWAFSKGRGPSGGRPRGGSPTSLHHSSTGWCDRAQGAVAGPVSGARRLRSWSGGGGGFALAPKEAAKVGFGQGGDGHPLDRVPVRLRSGAGQSTPTSHGPEALIAKHDGTRPGRLEPIPGRRRRALPRDQFDRA